MDSYRNCPKAKPQKEKVSPDSYPVVWRIKEKDPANSCGKGGQNTAKRDYARIGAKGYHNADNTAAHYDVVRE